MSQHAPSPLDETADPQKLRVLVVDDDPDSAESLAFSLQLEGRQVRYATCARDALKVAETLSPHFALIDVFMPQVDGHALAAELRQRFGHQIVVVAVTGALKSVELNAFDHHLMKPINFMQLDELLSQQRRSS
ncbi:MULTISPECIES: response regulator [unclassified Roseateles]|uniref:response regulator n=1 Tax=unclassified Roseateles TaxID=2626991 RepID=UPI000AD74787|nr:MULTISPECIES: response regulator [unclassified Roseateles]